MENFSYRTNLSHMATMQDTYNASNYFPPDNYNDLLNDILNCVENLHQLDTNTTGIRQSEHVSQQFPTIAGGDQQDNHYITDSHHYPSHYQLPADSCFNTNDHFSSYLPSCQLYNTRVDQTSQPQEPGQNADHYNIQVDWQDLPSYQQNVSCVPLYLPLPNTSTAKVNDVIDTNTCTTSSDEDGGHIVSDSHISSECNNIPGYTQNSNLIAGYCNTTAGKMPDSDLIAGYDNTSDSDTYVPGKTKKLTAPNSVESSCVSDYNIIESDTSSFGDMLKFKELNCVFGKEHNAVISNCNIKSNHCELSQFNISNCDIFKCKTSTVPETTDISKMNQITVGIDDYLEPLSTTENGCSINTLNNLPFAERQSDLLSKMKLMSQQCEKISSLLNYYNTEDGKIRSERQLQINTKKDAPWMIPGINFFHDYQQNLLLNKVEKTLHLLIGDASGKDLLQSGYKKKRNTPRNSSSRFISSYNPVVLRIMNNWYDRNKKHPYPSKDTCEVIAKSGNLTVDQVKKWFANRRRRECNTKTLGQIAKARRQHKRSANYEDVLVNTNKRQCVQ